MTYFVKGVVIHLAGSRQIMEPVPLDVQNIAASSSTSANIPPQPPLVGAPGVGQPNAELWAKTEPRPFILIGGFPGTIGSMVFSNTRVQEWVSGVLGWDEPEGPRGQPLAY